MILKSQEPPPSPPPPATAQSSSGDPPWPQDAAAPENIVFAVYCICIRMRQRIYGQL